MEREFIRASVGCRVELFRRQSATILKELLRFEGEDKKTNSIRAEFETPECSKVESFVFGARLFRVTQAGK